MLIYLTHSSIDKPFVSVFNNTLIAFGIDTFYDDKDIGYGEDIPGKIYDGLDKADFFIYFISNNSINSKWVQEELSIAKMYEKEKKKTMILPILIDKLDKIPASIKSKKYADLSDRKIDIHSQNFKLILKSLGISEEQSIKNDLKKIESNKVRSAIEKIVLFSSEMQIILSDISFMLRFISQSEIDQVYYRRFLETRIEIKYRNLFSKLEPILSNIGKIQEITFSKSVAEDVINRLKKFLRYYNEIMEYDKPDNPDNKWLIDAAESARSLQRRLGQLEHQLLVFYLNNTNIEVISTS